MRISAVKINPKVSKWILVGFLIASGLFDFFTFILNSAYHIFEINPIFIATKSVLIVTLLKFGFLTLVSWVLLRDKARTDFKRFGLILITIYVVFAQVLGGISNLHVQSEAPDPEQALEPQKAVRTFNILSLILVYFPVLFALISFKVWQWCYPRYFHKYRKIEDG